MTATAVKFRTASIRVSARLFDALLIIGLGLAVVALREAGTLPPDLTMPLVLLF